MSLNLFVAAKENIENKKEFCCMKKRLYHVSMFFTNLGTFFNRLFDISMYELILVSSGFL